MPTSTKSREKPDRARQSARLGPVSETWARQRDLGPSARLGPVSEIWARQEDSGRIETRGASRLGAHRDLGRVKTWARSAATSARAGTPECRGPCGSRAASRTLPV